MYLFILDSSSLKKDLFYFASYFFVLNVFDQIKFYSLYVYTLINKGTLIANIVHVRHTVENYTLSLLFLIK